MIHEAKDDFNNFLAAKAFGMKVMTLRKRPELNKNDFNVDFVSISHFHFVKSLYLHFKNLDVWVR